MALQHGDAKGFHDMSYVRKYTNEPRTIYTNAKREKEEETLQVRRMMVQQQKLRAQQSIRMRQSANGSGLVHK